MSSNKPKKKWYQKKWVWFLIVLFGLCAYGSSGDDVSAEDTANSPASSITQDVQQAEHPDHPTEPSIEPTIEEDPLVIELVAGEPGEYGELFTINKDTECEETYYIYHIPAGTYTVTNTGKYLAPFFVYSDEISINSFGWEEPAETIFGEVLDIGGSVTVTIEDGHFIEIHEPGKFILETTSEGEVNPAPTEEPTQSAESSPSPSVEPSEPPVESTFEIHFIDVGQADAALVLCDGKAMLIDGGNSADSSLIYSYLKKYDVSHLDYMVATHAHEDHVGGLSGALNYATVGTAFCSVKSYDSEAFNNLVKYLGKQNVSITVPAAGYSFKLGSADVQIIAPINHSDDPNNMSIVLRIVYGDTSFLFTGDAEREEEQDILNAGYNLDSTVLKVGHHGSDTSTTYPFLREIMPEYAVISVGNDNSYGHPTEDTLSRLRDADAKVFRTDMQGHIICTSDGKTVSFTVERNKDADTLQPPAPVVTQTPEPSKDPDPEPSQLLSDTVYAVKNPRFAKNYHPN